MIIPELLAPAGDRERLEAALMYGADAVYLAGTAFGMRAFAGNFTPEELPQAVKFAHDHGVKAHVTVNIMPRNDEIALLPAYLEQLDDAGDGVARVETVDAQVTQEHAQQQRGKPTLIGGAGATRRLGHGLPDSALGTYLGIDVDDLATRVAILLLFASHNL